MRFRFSKIFIAGLAVFIVGFLLAGASAARAQDAPADVSPPTPHCHCRLKIESVRAIAGKENFNAAYVKQTSISACEAPAGGVCSPALFPGKKYEECKVLDNLTACEEERQIWLAQVDGLAKAAAKRGQGFSVVGILLPQCVTEKELSEECRDVGVFLLAGINLATYLLGIVGALALLMFVYGGFTMILSQGNAEKTKKGFDIILSAVIGLAIVFSAYFLVKFLGSDVLGIGGEYRLK